MRFLTLANIVRHKPLGTVRAMERRRKLIRQPKGQTNRYLFLRIRTIEEGDCVTALAAIGLQKGYRGLKK